MVTTTHRVSTAVEAHRVVTGETLDGLARACGATWQEVALLNWGTSSPREVNRHLFEVVGCTRKTADGRNFVFDSADDPGIVYLPRPLTVQGLDTGESHVVYVRPQRSLVIRLEDERGNPLPAVAYRLTFDDGTTRSGHLGRRGAALLPDVPPRPFVVVYPDHEDILAKSLAACVRRSFDERLTKEVFRLLQHPPEVIGRALSAYDAFFNDHTGRGLIADIYQEFTDPAALRVVEGMMAYAGLAIRGAVRIAQRVDPHGGGDGRDGG